MCFLITLMTLDRCRYTILKYIDVLHTGYRTFKCSGTITCCGVSVSPARFSGSRGKLETLIFGLLNYLVAARSRLSSPPL